MELRNVIIGTSRFKDLAGAEITTLELAEEFQARGAEVAIASFEFGGEILALAQAAGVRCIDLTREDLSGETFDLAWIHHPPTYYALLIGCKADMRTIIYSSLSHYEPLESPPVVISRIDEMLVNSVENYEFFCAHYPDLIQNVTVFPNAVPRSFWSQDCVDTDHHLHAIAIVSNHPPDELLQAADMLRARSIPVDIYGATGTAQRVTPQLLDRYSAVITIGKTVQYSLARRRPVFCYDHFGGPGWIVVDNFDAAKVKNFSGRCANQRLSADELVVSIMNEYQAARNCIGQLYVFAIEQFCLERNVDALLKKIPFALPNIAIGCLSRTSLVNILSRHYAAFIRQQKAHLAIQESHAIIEQELLVMKTSRSWALTAPLRRVHQVLCTVLRYLLPH